jgi:predicted nucleic-acid-binding protein
MRVAVDTNVLVRFLVRDDEHQAALVFQRLKRAEDQRERLTIPLPVLLETLWVLESAYERSRQEILGALQALRHMPVFDFECESAVEGLIRNGNNVKADLSDVLIAHAAEAAGCETGLTFDKRAARLPFFQLLKG